MARFYDGSNYQITARLESVIIVVNEWVAQCDQISDRTWGLLTEEEVIQLNQDSDDDDDTAAVVRVTKCYKVYEPC